ncbi:NeuD/PglB/VioB family sugar acetyltransferase [Crocinitomicaceae bacterium]|nr:NeuD/PglB/VioB family sugar acetyltransferase [Crocinitomicaceae bacterium]
MSNGKVIVIGCGDQAEVVIDIIHTQGVNEIIGLTSKDSDIKEFCGYPVLGNDSILTELIKKQQFKLAMGVGGYRSNLQRKNIFNKLKKEGFDFINVIHPFTSISSSAVLGEGITIYPGTVINTSAQVEDNVILALNASIGHHTLIKSHILVSASASIGANTVVGEESLVAMGARIISGVHVGKNVTVGAGAVVVKSIESNKTVFGIPAKERE